MIVTGTLGRVFDRATVETLIPGKKVIDSGWDDDGLFWIQTDVNLSTAEVAAVRRRLSAAGSVEESLYEQGEQALTDDRAFRANTVPQLLAGADALIANPAATAANVKLLAQAVKALTNQVSDLSRQNIGLIRLVQRLLDAAD